jgi:hypothetical protein
MSLWFHSLRRKRLPSPLQRKTALISRLSRAVASSSLRLLHPPYDCFIPLLLGSNDTSLLITSHSNLEIENPCWKPLTKKDSVVFMTIPKYSTTISEFQRQVLRFKGSSNVMKGRQVRLDRFQGK